MHIRVAIMIFHIQKPDQIPLDACLFIAVNTAVAFVFSFPIALFGHLHQFISIQTPLFFFKCAGRNTFAPGQPYLGVPFFYVYKFIFTNLLETSVFFLSRGNNRTGPLITSYLCPLSPL